MCTVIFMPNTVTFLTLRDDVDVSAIAKLIGGDGNRRIAVADLNFDAMSLSEMISMLI